MLLIALIDTGVPVWALDAEASTARSDPPEQRGGAARDAREPPPLPEGRLVVADSTRALASLFGEPAAAHAPRARTRELTLFAIQVPGVPTMYVEEALWRRRAALRAAAGGSTRAARW